MSQTSASRGPCAIRSIAADSSLPSPKPPGFSDRRASMNGAIDPDHASTMRFEDSAIVCHSFAHSRPGSESAEADLSFSLMLLTLCARSGCRAVAERLGVDRKRIVEAQFPGIVDQKPRLLHRVLGELLQVAPRDADIGQRGRHV